MIPAVFMRLYLHRIQFLSLRRNTHKLRLINTINCPRKLVMAKTGTLEPPNNVAAVMFNHLLVEKILEYLEVSELKHFRLVCKFWNILATPVLAENVNIAIEGTRLEQCLQLICVPHHHHCSIKLFVNCTIKINSIESTNPTVSTMWSTVHHNIKHLHLHITTLYAKNELERLLLFHLPSMESLKLVIMKYWGEEQRHAITPYCSMQKGENVIQPNKNLKSFQLAYLGSVSLYGFNDDGDEHFRFPVKWKAFFARFPGLHQVSINGLDSADVEEMLCELLLFQINDEKTDFSLRSLEILDENVFPESPNDKHLQQITSLQNLESIHLEISPFVTTSFLTTLLRKHSNGLKSLRLRRYPHHFSSLPITLTETRMGNLTFVEVSEGLLESLSFLPYLPSLETLHILIRDYRHLNCCDIMCNTTASLENIHTGVKSVYIEPPLVSKDCIKKLAVCFPNVQSLKLRVNNEMLTEICEIAGKKNDNSFSNLKKLHITSWDGLTDEGVTGINEQILKFWGGFSSNTDIRNYRSKPFIGDIPDLSSLTIEMWSDYGNHVTDWSVLYGISEIPNLSEITLIRCGITSSAFSSISTPNKHILH